MTPFYFSGARVQIFPTNKIKIEPWVVNGWQTYGKWSKDNSVGLSNYLYLTGLGAVVPPVPDGQAAPSQRPVAVLWYGITPNHIFYESQSQPLFAGLAPGLVGMNQVDVQVPQVDLFIEPGTNVMLINISVSVAGASTAGGYIPIQATGS
jgi:uncharacterized protein (TIGR03437 family)